MKRKVTTRRKPRRFYRVVMVKGRKRKLGFLTNGRRSAEIFAGTMNDVADVTGERAVIEPMSTRKLLTI